MKSKTNYLVITAFFAALTVIGGFIKVYVPPVPFTLQLFFAILSGLILGPKWGLISQLVYIAIGLLGVPVFSDGGGFHYIFNHKFGYIIGFAGAAYTTGLISRIKINISSKFLRYLLSCIAGILVCYLVGIPYLYIILNYVSGIEYTFSSALVKGFLLFLPWDIVKAIAASLIAVEIKKRLKQSFLDL